MALTLSSQICAGFELPAFRQATNKPALDDGVLTGEPPPDMYGDFQIEAVNLPAAPFSPPYFGISARSSSRVAPLKSHRGDPLSAFHQVMQLADNLVRY